MYTSFTMATQWILAGLGIYLTAKALWIKADIMVISDSIKKRERALTLGLLVTIILAVAGPFIAQVPGYNHFADSRNWLGIPNAADVLSNLPFAILGVIGFGVIRKVPLHGWEKHAADLFFIGLIFVAIGSSFYHLVPDNTRLVFDRLGIAVAIAGIASLAVFQRISNRMARVVAVVLYWGALATVYRWDQTGNLMPWGMVQLGTMILLLVLAFVPPRAEIHQKIALLPIVLCYAVAKVFELEDQAVFALTHHVISGHTLKHLASALAAWPVIAAYTKPRG